MVTGTMVLMLMVSVVLGGLTLEHKTYDILAAERLRLMRFDYQLIIDSFQEAICILKW